MITAEELVSMTEQEQQEPFKLATVVELFEIGTAKVQFDGEEEPSQKEYSYLASYTPVVGDRVLLASVAGTYVIMDKIMYKEVVGEDTGDASGSFTSLTVEGNTKTNTLDVAEQANFKNINASDNVGFKKDLNVEETANLKNILCNGNFAHNIGGYFGVFGTNPISQKSCSTLYSSSNLGAVINKVNEIINHLKDYGFFR